MTGKKRFEVPRILEILREGPEAIWDATHDLSSDELRARPAPDEWSAHEILAHLRACADVWGGCIETMLSQDHPTITGVNPRRWILSSDLPKKEFHASLREFAEQRRRLMSMLEPLGPDGWNRSATIRGAGKPLTKTVLDYADRLARHERPHIRQIRTATIRG